MIKVQGYAVKKPSSAFEPFNFERREVGSHDVLIKILYCGICHSDIHMAKNEWGSSVYPMVPGHEIAGEVIRTGEAVKKFKVGDKVGVGCFVDSCRHCHRCEENEEQFCEKHLTLTYSGMEQDLKTLTYGGYSSHIVVDENYVLKIPSNLPLSQAAPLLCAGITTYAPLRRFHVEKNKKIAIAGLGGLGHMGVKFAAAMGAEVSVLSTSPSKAKEAARLGANHFFITTEAGVMDSLANRFDVILMTAGLPYEMDNYLGLLRKGGVMVIVGLPDHTLSFKPFSLVGKERILAGSLIGGIRETQEMLDYCGEKGISADIELIPPQKIEEAYARTLKGDVRFRFVIDMTML